jgi:hypothetical protein
MPRAGFGVVSRQGKKTKDSIQLMSVKLLKQGN